MYPTKSKILAASGQVTTAPGAIYSITVTGAVAANTIQVKNNTLTGAGGTVIFNAAFTPGVVDTRHYTFPAGLNFTTNCWIVVANATDVSVTYKDNA